MPVGIFKGVDFTGYYEISTFGNARSLDRLVTDKNGVKRFLKGGYKWIYSDVYNKLTADELFEMLNKPKLNTREHPVVQLNLNYKLIKKQDSITDAAKNGYKKNRIWDCLNNKRNKHYGYRWMYLEDYEKLDNNS